MPIFDLCRRKMLCEYLKMGRKSLDENIEFRSPELGPVHFFGITARNWHEVAIRFGEQLIGVMLTAVDTVAAMWASVDKESQAAMLDQIEFQSQWPTIATAISRLPQPSELETFMVYLELEAKAADLSRDHEPASQATKPKADLTEKENNICEAVGKKTLTGEQIAKAAGYPFNSDLRNRLSQMLKRGVLAKGAGGIGYRLPPCQ